MRLRPVLKYLYKKKDGKWKISHATDRLLNVVYCDLLRKGKSEEEYVKEIKDMMEKNTYIIQKEKTSYE